ncbi:hypothetical protein EJB05_03863 [Eragrostis curvula]|uniref:WH2 domain-containing protein n=1 Tax=Eragrostis curvula TaxID=38414 RepID=A0A5J9W6U8_9POAL|nr:hypothetical protein EJB05_03863 [Eragrostis curvula]
MIRYQIRNEYGQSDPALYAAPGEEDDPEALLEGVAMAGLVGLLRQLGDLAEFAAEIFHDLHEDVMATASRGHGLMLRLQQLEAEFPAAEKAIISQIDHSNYPHDEGVEWHPNLQFKQNMITQGDMPRFILDSYEECRGPPHLFTLDKFDVAGAGASLKRYSDPSFFKTEHASNMIESDVIMEKKPRRIKKKAMRWRKGVTLEALLVANSESQTTSKDRASRKVPPRTTKLKSRRPRSPDYKTISRICREHLQEVISSQQKIMSSYSARHYHVKFGSTESSETTSPLGDLNIFGARQSTGKLELSKVVPINESDAMDTISAPPNNGSAYLEADGKHFLGKQHESTELKEVSKMSPVEQNGMICESENLQDCPDLLVGENNHSLQSTREGKLLLADSHAEQDADGCRSDDIASDQDNFVDAPNNMDSEGVIDPEIKVEHDPNATVEGNEFNYGSKEGEDASEAKFLEVGHTIESSAGLNVSRNVEEPTCLDLNDSAPSTVATTNDPNSVSPSGRQLSGVDWTNDEESFRDEDLMDVSSSSSVASDNADQEAIDDSVDRQQYHDGAYQSLNADVHSFDGQSPKTSSDPDGLAFSSNDCADKKCHSVNHGQNFVLDGSSMSSGGTNDVSEDEEEINVGVPKENVSPSPAGLDPDDIHEHLDGIAVKHPNMHNNLLYESNDEEIVEDVLSLPDDDLSTPFNMHVAEDHQVVVLDEGTCADSLDTQKEDSVQSCSMDKDFAYAEELPGVIQGESPSRYDREVYERETLEPSSYVFNDDTEPLNIGEPQAPSTSSLCETTCPCVEQLELTETEDTRECGKVVATEESAIRKFADGVPPPEEDDTDAAKYEGETPAPSSSVFNDDTEPLVIGEPLAPSTSSLHETTSPCMEQLELTEMEDTRECGNLVATEESTVRSFADGMRPSEEDTDAAKYEGETPAPSSCVFNDDTEPLNIGVPLAPSTSSLRETTNACVEQHELTEMEYKMDCGKAVVTEESTTSSFADGVVPTEGEITDAANNSDKAEVLATEEDSRHDVQLPSSYPFREELETVEASCRTLGVLDESREHICMLQTGNTPFNETETTGGKCSDDDDDDAAHFLSSEHFPEESHCEEQLLEEANLNAEVLPGCNSDKDGAASLKNNAVENQQANVDQDLVWVATQDSSSNTVNKQQANENQDLEWDLSAQDSSSTNPFMDPAYMTTHAQIYPSSSMSYPPYISEEQDFLSELLIEHDNMRAGTDSLWEPATPPDEAPLPSEVMTEEDFRSFCDEYHEMNFKAHTEGFHGEPASDSNNISIAIVDSESDWACSVSAQAVKLDQEGLSGFQLSSQRAECSSASDAHADTSIPFSVKKHLEDETPEVASHLNSHGSFSDNRSPELDMVSVPMGLQEQQHNLCGVDSHSSHLFDKEKTNEECCSPLSKVVAVTEELEIHANLVSHSFVDENLDELDVPPSNALPVESEAGAHVLDEHNNKDGPFCVFGEFDSLNNPPSSMDEDKDNPEASVSRTFQAEQDSECFPSDDHDSQTALSSSLDEKIDELDGHPLSNAVILDEVPEVCAPCGLDSGIIPCSTDEKIYGQDRAPLSSSVLVELESENHVLSDRDSQVTPCYFVKDKIDESEAAPQNSGLYQEQEKDVHASPVLDSPPVSLSVDKVGEIDGSPSCNVQVESDCRTEFDSQTAPYSLSSDALVDRTALTPVMPSTEKAYQLSLDPPSTVPFQNDSFEDLQKPPPLPPLQWRLGRPRLGLLNTKGSMPESARRTYPILQASSQEMDTGLGLLDQTNRSVEPVPSQGLKEDTDKSSMIDGSDENVEFRSLSASVAETDFARPFSEASDNIKQQEHMSSSATRTEEHPDDSTGTSKTGVEEHLDSSDVTHGTALYPTTDPLLPSPTHEQQDAHVHILSLVTSEKSEHPIHTHPDDHNAPVDMVSTSIEGHISASRSCQQVDQRESLSENLEHNEHTEDNIVKHLSIKGEAPSDTATHSAPDLPLDEENSQKSQTLQEQNLDSSEDSLLGGSLPSAESMAPQDCPNDRHNLEREKINQPSGPGLGVSGLDEGSYLHAEQPPVMGWTVGPQMLHPNYGVPIEEGPYAPSISDNHLIRKPISIKNIPRNPLVDAVAAHDRSSMRKVSELPPPADKPKPNERNLLLEQIRNKAVGSDDEDGDNWSD